MDYTAIVVAGSGLFLAGMLKGTTGLGYSSCALPFLVPIVGIKAAISILIIPVLTSNLQVVFTAGHFSETVKRFLHLYLSMIPGIGIGIFALNALDARISGAFLGLVIVAYAVFAILRPPWQLTSLAEKKLQIPVGILNGFVTGLTGSQVMPLFPYIMSLGLDANRLVQAINVAVTLATVILALGLFSIGAITTGSAFLSAMAIVPAMAGVSLGSCLRSYIPIAHFRLLVLAVLFAMGCSLLYTSIL